MTAPLPPVVLCFSGLDPSGGAGLSADIEALASLGCHCAPIVTVLTVQDTSNVLDLDPVDPEFIKAQAQAVMRDLPIAAIKVGLLGNPAVASAVAEICASYPNIPLVVDPVLASGAGTPLADEMFIKTLKKALLPLATLVTPNAREIQLLFPDADSIDQCAEELLDLGCEHVLVTGADEPTPVVHNVLYSSEFETETFHWERLPAMYHGSGCTLAAACAGLIAQGLPLFDAINEAQEYTFNALKDGHALGQGQLLPNRLFWAQSRETEGEEPDESDEG